MPSRDNASYSENANMILSCYITDRFHSPERSSLTADLFSIALEFSQEENVEFSFSIHGSLSINNKIEHEAEYVKIYADRGEYHPPSI